MLDSDYSLPMLIQRSFQITFTLIKIFRENRKVATGQITKDQFGKYLKRQLEGLGPTFIKVGQILSLRPDLVPIEYCMELRGLLDKTPEMPLRDILIILRRELGQDPSKVFSHISKNAIASASLAQVHKGKLRGKDAYVAIKVKKVGVEKLIRTDVLILKILNKLFSSFIQKRINSRALISDIQMILDKEVDFVKEGMNAERSRDMFKEIKFVKVPTIYWDNTTRNLLIMEFIPGISMNKVFHKIDRDPSLYDLPVIEIDGLKINKALLAHRLIQVTAHSVFEVGFFHADPHPANIILTYDNHVAYIDFGMVGDLLNSEKILFRELVYCIVTEDEERSLQLLMEYNRSLGYPPVPDAVVIQLKHFLHDLFAEFVASDQKHFPITKFMYSLGGMAFKFRFPPPPFLMLISKQIFTLEGLAHYLIPDLDIIKEFKPYVYSYRTKDSLKKFSNEKILKVIDDTTTLGLNLPESLNTIIENLKNDGMVRTPSRKGPLHKSLFIILTLYLGFMGIMITLINYNIWLILTLWGSIITILFILYIIFFENGQS